MPNLLTTIGTALFGEKGLAGGVVDTLQSIGLLKDPKEAQAAIERMKSLELRGEELDVEKLKATIADQTSARSMQSAALTQEDRFAKRFIYWFAIFSVGLTMAYAFAITFIPIPKANVQMAWNVLYFLLGAIIGTIFTFFYGTSYGSLQKNKQIESLAGNQKE